MSYIYGLERLARQANTGENEYYLPDRLGSVRQVAGESGFPSFAQEFDPYGNLIGYAGRGGSSYAFAGELGDPSGFTFLRARYYSPIQGRFITRDPFPGLISQPASLNPYAYALNNPVLYTDPSGEFVETIFDAAMLGYDLFTIIDKASRGCSIGLADWGALGLDALSLAVPFLPAAGMAIRFAAHADDMLGSLKSFATITKIEKQTDKTYSVYRSIVNGTTTYVGITNNFFRRASEHFRETGKIISKFPGLENLSRQDARAVEQVLIEHFKLSKHGGTLRNLINSISSKRGEFYKNAFELGTKLLDDIDPLWRQWK